MPKPAADQPGANPVNEERKHSSDTSEKAQRRIKLPELPDDISTGQPGVEDLPHGKRAAREASRPRDD